MDDKTEKPERPVENKIRPSKLTDDDYMLWMKTYAVQDDHEDDEIVGIDIPRDSPTEDEPDEAPCSPTEDANEESPERSRSRTPRPARSRRTKKKRRSTSSSSMSSAEFRKMAKKVAKHYSKKHKKR